MIKSNAKSRINSISRATGRAYTDSKRIWETIKDEPVPENLPILRHSNGTLELKISEDENNDASSFFFESVNYLKHGLSYQIFSSNHADFFLNNLVGYGNECNLFNVVEADEKRQQNNIFNAQKDYEDRSRILQKYPNEKFNKVIYVVKRDFIKLPVFENAMEEVIKNIQDYSKAGIYLLFVDYDRYPKLSVFSKFDTIVNNKIQQKFSTFIMDKDNVVHHFVNDKGETYSIISESFNNNKIPEKAKYSDIKKVIPETFALGLGKNGEQINWGCDGSRGADGFMRGHSLSSAPNGLIYYGNEPRDYDFAVQLLGTIAKQSVESKYDVRISRIKEKIDKNNNNYVYADPNYPDEAKIYKTVEDSLDMLHEVHSTIKERYNILEKEGINNWLDYGSVEDRIIVIVENSELFTFNTSHTVEFNRIITKLSRLGRAAGVHVICAGSKFMRKSNDKTEGFFNGETKANFGIRISCGNPFKHEEDIFGISPSKNTLYKHGQARIRTYGSEITEFRIFK